MKKICLLGIAMMTGVAAMAQESLVKDVEHQLKGAMPDYVSALNAIQPALTNPATANNVNTWMLAARAAFGCYDNVFDAIALGNKPSNEAIRQGSQALVDGYNYYFRALQLDSMPNEKGKVKPKESKNILKKVADYYPQVRNAGAFLYDTQDLDGAFNAWELYCQLPSIPEYEKAKIIEDADSVVGQIMFYQGVCKLQNGDNLVALRKMEDAIKHNYNNIYAYTYGVEAARRVEDYDKMFELAKLGYDKFGTEDVQFVGQLINYYLAKKDYPAAMQVVEEGIASTPAENTSMLAQIWDIKGYIQEWNNDNVAAKDSYTKSIELDPTYAKAFFDLARMYYNEAQLMRQESQDVVTPEIEATELHAAELFKKAYALDEMVGDGKVAGILWHLYYGLGEKYVDDAEEWKALQ